MNILSELCILIIIIKIIYANECCPLYISVQNCSDGSNISLECENGRYRLTENEFSYDGNNLILVGETKNHSINNDMFCIGVEEDLKTKVAIVCFNIPEKDAYMQIYSICLLISDLFLVITLIIYAIFPTLRDLQGKCVMSFTANLCIGYFILAILQQQFFDFLSNICEIIAFVLYYFLMSAFLWLSIISFNIWRTATWQNNWSDTRLEIIYNIIGYGISAIFLIAVILAHQTPGNHVKPDFSISCWFTEPSETWTFFYGPMAILLCCNMLFFTLTAIRLWKDYKDSSPGKRIQVLRFKCLLYLKMFLAMGIPWIFEVASYIFAHHSWIITDIINSLQGVIIFIVMIATRKKVLFLLANHDIFAKCINKKWETINDEESEREIYEEQLQLS